MIHFALGAAAIVFPKPVLPVLVAIKAAQGVRKVLTRRKEHDNTDSQSFDVLDAPVEPVTLEWSQLNCVLTKEKNGAKTEKRILKNVAGSARPGRLLAIMGPSGSGKTSLLNALAGQVPQNSKITLRGRITVNGEAASESNHKQAYVQQEDIFYSQMTVLETLLMAAELRLPTAMPTDRKRAYVDNLINILGLAKSADTMVGDAKTRGLSGGEKKRLSIGCELIGSASLVFLDEPTTGLDSFQAQKVMGVLKSLAAAGHTVVCSIHQPRSSIFSMFDDLVLLSEGSIVYAGHAEDVVPYFAGLGHSCPEHYNPAEFVADLISIDFASADSEATTRARVEALVASWQQQQASRPQGHMAATTSGLLHLRRANAGPQTSWMSQLRLLFRRSWRQVTRDKAAAISRIMANVSSAIIFGAIFWRLKMKQTSIQDRLGLLQVASINAAMSALVKTLNVFPTERLIVTRERAKQSYQTMPYLLAKLAAELPMSALFPAIFGAIVYPLTGLNPKPSRFLKFLGVVTLESFSSAALGLAVGAFAPSTEAAMAIGPAVMVVFIVFGGYYVNADNVLLLLRWLPNASLIKRSFEGLCVNEFKGLEFEQDGEAGAMKDGGEVLNWLSFNHTSLPKALVGQARILLFYYWATFNILHAKKPKFQPLLPAAAPTDPDPNMPAPPPPPATTAHVPAQ